MIIKKKNAGCSEKKGNNDRFLEHVHIHKNTSGVIWYRDKKDII